jgi:hypothetical protein
MGIGPTKKNAELLLALKVKGQKDVKALNNFFKSFVITAGDVARAVGAIGRQFVDFAKKAAQFQVVQRSFEQLAASQGQQADQMLAKMKELSGGTVSNLELMKQANTALLLGLPVDRFGDMLKIASTASAATGESMQFMLKSIVTGLGRGSKLILDNLGILVNVASANEKYAAALGRTASSLSDAEKKQAFINEALRVGKANADKMSGSSDNFKTNLERLEATIEDTSTALGAKLLPAGNLAVKMFNKMIGSVGKAFEPRTVKSMSKEMEVLKQKQDEILKRNNDGAVSSFLWGKAGEKSVQARIDALQKLIDAEQLVEDKKTAAARKGAADRKLLKDEELLAADIAKEDKRLLDEQTAEEDRLFKQALRDEEFAADVRLQQDQIRAEKDTAKKLQLIDRLKFTKEVAIDKERRKKETDFAKFKAFLQSEEVKGAQNVFGRISSLQQSQSKFLVGIGKAAAIANIAISTAGGIMKSIEIFGIPFGLPFAAAVGAAGAVQTAKVAGVNLAEGGIVSATPGGVQATIAEGGQDEAVIPLPDEGLGLGATLNVNVGVLVGGEEGLNELTGILDQKFFELRQENASVAFDEGIV